MTLSCRSHLALALALSAPLLAQTTFNFNNGENVGANYNTDPGSAGNITASTPGTVSGSISGTLSGSGSLTKTGTGTLTLSGTNTYSGGTTVSAGTLAVTTDANLGDPSGDVTVAAGATLSTGGYFGFNRAITADGSGASIINNGELLVGFGGTGSLNLSNGATVSGYRIDLGFTGGTGTVTVGSGSSISVNEVAYYTPTSTVNLNDGGTLTTAVLSGSGIFNLAGGTLRSGASYNSGIAATLSGSSTIDTNGFDNVFSGILSGDGSLTKSGTGTLTLTGANSYTGATTVSGGTLQIGNGSTTGSLASTAITNDAQLTFNRSDDITFDGVIGGTGNLTQAGSGTLTFTGANTYTGTTTIDAGGTLQLGDGTTNGSVASASIVNNGTFVLNRNDNYTFNSVVSGTGDFVNDGYIVRLANAQTYTGSTSVKSGGYLVLSINEDNSLSDATVVDIESGGVLDLSNRPQTIAGLTGNGTVYSYPAVGGNGGVLTVDVTDGDTHTFAGVLGGDYPNFAFTKDGDGTQILSGANTYTGATTISGGTLQIGAGGTTGSIASTTVTNNGNLAFNRSDSVSFDSTITGTGSLTQSGSGTLTLGGTNTYTGTTTVTGGTLAIGGQSNLGTGNITVSNGGTLSNSGSFELDRNVTVTGSGSSLTADQSVRVGITGNGELTIADGATVTPTVLSIAEQVGSTGTVNVNSGGTLRVSDTDGITTGSGTATLNFAGGTLDVNGENFTTSANATLADGTTSTFATADSATWSGVLSGSGSLVKSGGNTLILANANTFTGTTELNEGTLELAHTDALQGSTLDYSDGTLSFGTLTAANLGGLTGSSTLALQNENSQAVALTVGANNTSTTFDGYFTDTAGSLVKTGTGTLTLNNLNYHTGSTTIADGTLRIAHDNALGAAAGNQLIFDGGTLANTGSTVTLDSDRAVILNAGGGTLDGAFTYNGVITGTGDLTKTGASSTLTLGGANTFTGDTHLDAGTLQLDHAQALQHSTLDIGAAGTLTADGGITTLTLGGLAGSGNITESNVSADLVVGSNDEDTTYSGAIDGNSRSFTKVGSGTLTLAATNSFGDGVTINGGTLSIAQAANLGSSDGSVTLDGGTLATTATLALDDRELFVGSNQGTIDTADSTTLTVGQINVADTLTKTGTGTLALNDSSVSLGSLLINAGTVRTNAEDIDTTADITVAASAVLDLNDHNQEIGSLAGAGTVALGSATLTTGGNSTATTFSGNITGTGGLTKAGADDFTLSGNNTYTGTTLIDGGTLIVGSTTALAGTTAIEVGGTLDLNGHDLTMANLSGSGIIDLGDATATLTTGSANNQSFERFLGSGALVKEGTGTLTVTTVFSADIATSVDAGTLDLNANTVTINSLDGAGNIALGSGALTTGDANDHTLSGTISGTGGAFTKAGSGSLTLSGANTYTGATNVTGGTLVLAHNDQTLANTTALTVSNGATLDLGAANESVGSVTLIDGTITSATHPTLSADSFAVQNGTIDVYLDNKGTAANLTKTTTGTVTFTGTVQHGGITDVQAGTVVVSGENAGILSTSSVAIGNADTATLTLDEGAGLLATSTLTLGGTATGNGTFNITAANPGANPGENLNAFVQGDVIVGGEGTGTVAVSGGGVLRSYGDVRLATGTDGTATVTVSGTDGTSDFRSGLNTLGSFVIAEGEGSTATFTVSNGASSGADAGITIAAGVNSTGTLTVTGTDATAGTHSQLLAPNVAASETTPALTLALATGAGSTANLNILDGGEIILTDTESVDALTAGAGTANVTLNDGTLSTTTGGTLTSNVAIATAGNNTLNTEDGAIALSGVLSGTGSLTKTGTGTLTLSGDNTFSGDTTISAGSLTLGHSSALQNSTVTTATGLDFGGLTAATLGGLSGSGDLALENTSSDDLALTVGGNDATTTYSGVLSAGGSLTKTGLGALTLAGTNTYSGSTTINGGTVSIAADAALGTAPGSPTAGHLTLDGGTLATTATFELNANRGIALGSSGGTLATSDATALTYGGIIDGSGSLTKSGAGSLTLSGANTFSGDTTINAGTLILANADALQNSTLTTATGLDFGNLTAANLGGLAGSLNLALTNSATTPAAVALTVGANNATTTYSGELSGTGSLTKSGSGNLTLAGANTFSGDTTVSGGTLTLAHADALQGSTVTTISGISFGSLTEATFGGLTGTGNFGLTNGSSGVALTIGANQQDTAYVGTFWGTGSLTKVGTGTLTLDGLINSHQGGTFVEEGVLALNNSNNLGSGQVSVTSGAELRVNANLRLNQATTVDGANSLIHTTGGSNYIEIASGGNYSGSLTVSDGGTASTAGSVTFAVQAINSASGTVTGNDSTLSVGTDLNVGFLGDASLDISAGGAVDVGGNAYIANQTGSESTATVTGTGSTFDVTNTLFIGPSGTATITIADGGTVTANAVILANTSAGANATLNLNAGGTLATGGTDGLSQGPGTATFNLAGGTLKVNGTDLTSSLDSALADATTSTVDTNGLNATLSGDLTGSGNLTKSGTGILTLSGNASYTGATAINGGTLQLGSSNALTATSSVDVAAAATLDLNSQTRTYADLDGAGNLALGSGTLTTGDSDNHSLSGVVSGSGSLVKNGTGTLTLSGTNTYEGGTTINDGTLSISADTNLGNSTGGLTLNGGTLRGTADLTLGSGRTITLDSSGGTLEAAYPSTLTVESTITGSGNLGLDGEGNIILGAANTHTGTTTFLDGDLTVTLANENALQNSELTTTGGLRFGSLTAANIGAISGSQDLTLANGSSAAVALSVGEANATTSHSGTVSGSGSLTVTGGDLTLSGANTFTGDTTVSGGTLTLANSLALQNSTLVTDVGTINFSGASDYTLGGLAGSTSLNTPSSGTLTVGGNDANTSYSGSLNTSSTTFVKTGAGNFSFAGAFNDSSTTVRLDEGTFTLGTTNGLDDVTVDLNGGDLSFGSLTSATLGNLSGSGDLALTNTAATPADVALTVGYNSNDADYDGVMSGGGSLTKTGSGTFTLSDAQTFTGETTVTGGTLALTSSGALTGGLTLDGGNLTLGNATGLANSTVTLNNGDVSYNGVSAVTFGGLAGSDDITLPSTSLTVGGNDANTSFSGYIQGSGTLIKAGDGNLTFSGNVYDSAAFQLDAGTFTLGTSSALERSTVTLNGGALSFGTLTSASLDGLNGSTDLALTNAAEPPAAVALTIGYNGGDSTYSGALSGAGSLTKTGFGTFTLNSANTFTGITTISDGTLALGANGALAGPVHLDSGTLSLANSTGLQDSTVHLNGGNLTYNGVTAVTFGGISGSNTLDLPSTSLTVGGNDANTSYTGTVYNSGTFIKAGDGNLTFGGYFNDSAPVRLDAGTFTLGNSSALERNIVTLNGGALSFGTLTSASLDGLNGSTDLALTNAAETPAAVALTVGYNGGSSTYSGELSGSGSLTKTGSGTFTLNGTNTFTGDTTINDGTLALGASGSLTGDVNLSSGTLSLGNATGLQHSTVTLNGGNLSYGSGVDAITFGGLAGSNDLTLPSTSLTVGGNNANTSYTGTVYNSGTFIKAGTGNLTFGGYFNDSAPVRLDAGTFTVGNSSALANNEVTLNGGTLSFGAQTSATLGGLAGSSNLALANASSAPVALTVGNTTYDGVLSGPGSLQFSGAQFTLGGDNTFLGTTVIDSGDLYLTHANALGSTAAGTSVAYGSTIYFTGADTYATAESFSGDGDLHKTAAGTWSLSGANTLTGSTVVEAGTLVFANRPSFYNGDVSGYAGQLIVQSGATAAFAVGDSGYFSSADLSSLTENANFQAGSFLGVDTTAATGPTTFAHTGSFGLNKLGTGTLALAPASTGTGPLTITGGTLEIGDLTSGTLSVSGITNDASLAITNANALTYAGTLAGTGAVTKSGAGTFTVTGTDTGTGDLAITAGTYDSAATGTTLNRNVTVTGADAVLDFSASTSRRFGDGEGAAGSLTITDGGTVLHAATSTLAGIYIGASGGSGTGLISGAGSSLISQSVLRVGYSDGTGDLTISDGGTATFNNTTGQSRIGFTDSATGNSTGTVTVTGPDSALNLAHQLVLGTVYGGDNAAAGTLTIADGGTVTADQLFLASGPTATGTLNLNTGGTLVVSDANATALSAGSGTAIFNFAGGTLKSNGTHSLTVTTDATLADGTTSTFDTNGQAGTWTGILSGNGAFTKAGAGTLVLSNAGSDLSLVSQLTLAGGTLQLASVDVLDGNFSAVNFDGGLLGFATTGTLPDESPFTLGANGGGFAIASGQTLTIDTTLEGEGALTLSGPGTLELTNGSNAYTGGTVITGGATVVLADGDDNLGESDSTITLDLGTLSVSEGDTFETDRNFNLGSGGGTFDGDFIMDGTIAGTGGLTKAGSGTLLLQNISTYTGDTTVAGGTLHFASGAAFYNDVVDAETAARLHVASGATASFGVGSEELFSAADLDQIRAAADFASGATLGLDKAGAPFTYASAITDTNGGANVLNLATTGGGILYLTGHNTYTGTTTLDAGITIFGHKNAFYDGQVTALNAQKLTVDGTVGFGVGGSNSFTQSDLTTLLTHGNIAEGSIIGLDTTAATGGTATMTDLDVGNFNLAKTGSGTLVLAGTTGPTGTLFVEGGTLAIGDGSAASVGFNYISLFGTLVFNHSNDLAYSGTVANSGSLTKSGSGNLTLSGSNSYRGATTVEAGTLTVASSSALGESSTGTTVEAGATLAFSNDISVGTEAIANSGTVTNTSGSNSYAGALSGSGNLTVAAGQLTLSGTNTYAGGTTVANGTLAVTDASQLGSGAVSVQSGGTLSVSNNATFNQTVSVDGSGATFAASTANDYDLFGYLDAVLGASPVLTDFSHFNGDLTVSNGGALTGSLLAFGTGVDSPASGSILSGGTLSSTHFVLGGDATATVDLTVSGNDSQLATSALNIGVANSAAATLTIADGATFAGDTITLGNDDGSGRLHIASGGTVQASAIDLHSADSLVQVDAGGLLQLSTADLLYVTIGGINADNGLVAGAQTLLNGGTIEVTTAAAMDFNTDITLGAGTTSTINTGSATVTAPGEISGTGALAKAGDGSLVLSGANTFTGDTQINAGTLVVGHSQALQNSTVSLPGGSLTFGDVDTATLGGLTGSGSISLEGVDLSVGQNHAHTTFSGTLTDAGTLTKIGTGTLTLSGTNTYSGDTTVAAGTLALASAAALGSTDTGTTVASGATLAFTNDITVGTEAIANAGTVTNASGANRYAGVLSGEGSLNVVAGSLTLSGDNTYTGATTIADGATLRIEGGYATTSTSSPTDNLFSLLAGGATQESLSTASLSNAGTLEIAGAGFLFLDQTLTGGGDLAVSGMSAVGLNGSNNVLGEVNVASGASLYLLADTTLASLQTHNSLMSVNSGTTTVSGSIELNSDNGTGSGALNVESAGTINVSGNITNDGTASVSVSGGSLNLSGDLILAGTTNNATVRVEDGGSATIGGDLVLNGILTPQGENHSPLGDTGVTIGAGSSLRVDGAIQLGIDAGTNGYLNIDGTLQVGGNGGISTGSGETQINLITGTLQVIGSDLTSAADIQLSSTPESGTATIDTNSLNATLNGDLTGIGSLTKTGTGTLTLGGTNTYAGGTAVNAGTLAVTDQTQLGTGEITITNGGTLSASDPTQLTQNLTIDGSGSRFVAPSSSGNLNTFDPADFSGSTATTTTVTNGGSLEAGFLGFGGSTSQASTVEVSAGGSLTTQQSLVVGYGNQHALTFNVTGAGSSVTAADIDTYTGNALVIGAGNPNALATMTVSDGGSVSAEATFIGFNFISAGQGQLDINDGGTVQTKAVVLTDSGSDQATLNLNTGGSLRIVGGYDALQTGTGSYNVNLNGGTLAVATNTFSTSVDATLGSGTTTTFHTDGVNATWFGDLSGSGNLTKTGAETLTLDGANTTTGTITIAGGTLALGENGTIAASAGVNLGTSGILDLTAKSSGFSFSAGQTLAGTGTVNLAPGQTLDFAGTLAPGNSPGIVTIDGNLVLNSAAIVAMELAANGTMGTPGTDFDQIVATGSITLAGTLNLSGYNGYTPQVGDSFQLFSSPSSIGGSFAAINYVSSGFSGTVGWNTSDLANGYLSISSVSLSAVPEPSTYAALAGLAMLAFAFHRRRRRTRSSEGLQS